MNGNVNLLMAAACAIFYYLLIFCFHFFSSVFAIRFGCVLWFIWDSERQCELDRFVRTKQTKMHQQKRATCELKYVCLYTIRNAKYVRFECTQYTHIIHKSIDWESCLLSLLCICVYAIEHRLSARFYTHLVILSFS